MKFRDRFIEGGAQGVVHGFGGEIRAGRDEMQRHAEGRAGLGAVFENDMRLIDLTDFAEGVERGFDVGGEGGRGLMVQVLGGCINGVRQCCLTLPDPYRTHFLFDRTAAPPAKARTVARLLWECGRRRRIGASGE